MEKQVILLPVLLLVCLVACKRVEVADLVLKNGVIVTIDKENPRAQAVAVARNIIVAVGSDVEIEKHIKPGVTKVIDLQGKMVVPGFNDAHIHFLLSGSRFFELRLHGVTSFQQMSEMVAEQVAASEPGEWIIGRGWDHNLMPGKVWPTKEILDEVAPENPVMLGRICGHSSLVNSAVLEKSGITRDTPDPEGGTIVRDRLTGEPTGILKELALALIKRPVSSPEEKARLAKKYLELSLEEARRFGVTSITHLQGGEKTYEEFQKEGRLTLRVNLCQALTDNPDKIQYYHELKEKYRANSLIRFGSLKAFMDGSMGSQTAALFEPFTDNPSTSGILTEPVEKMEKLILNADREKFQVCIHAIGTRANHIILNAYEKAIKVNGKRDSRHRIEHAQILIENDVPRFAELGVIASMQPAHCITDLTYAESRLGRERCRYAYAWRSILEAGGRIAFGTDCSMKPMDPIEGLYAAVSRKSRDGLPAGGWFPEEKLTMEEAIELYTLGPAYASFEENLKGSIEPGKLADMAVLSQNLLEIPEQMILDTRVVYTVFDGKIIYENR